MKTVHSKMEAQVDGEFVVFLIGMRINKPWKVNKWLPMFLAMPRMLRELSRDPERNGSEVAVPDREDRVGHRRSQGHGVLAPHDPVDAGPDGGLRGPVEVPELPHLRMQRTGQVGGELLPRAHSDERGISLPARVEEHAPQ